MSFSDKIGKLNDALFPTNPSKETDQRLGVFGGESFGFAHGVETLFAKSFYANGAAPDEFAVAVGMNKIVPRSIFNRYALFNFRGMYGGLTGGEVFNGFFDQPNNPIMGGEAARNLSIAKLMEYFNENYPRISYTAQDFLYCKYYKKIPVNHLITLRRFPTPVNDNIFDLKLDVAGKDPKTPRAASNVDATQTAGVTAVTYMGEQAGNKLDDILTMSYGLNYKEVKSEMEDISSGDGGYTSQPFYSKMGGVGRATADAFKGISSCSTNKIGRAHV